MKHNIKITLILVLIFLIAQVVGLFVTDQYIAKKEVSSSGNVTIEWKELPMGIERPEFEEQTSYIWIIVGVLIGTAIALIIIKFKKIGVWRVWFFLSVSICLIISFNALFIPWIAIPLGLGLAIWKIFRPGVIVHNVTEIFLYGGLAAIFVPLMNFFAAIMLLLIISVYDMIAVWQSKHMITLAKFQTGSRLFAGLFIPYEGSKLRLDKGKPEKIEESPAQIEKEVKNLHENIKANKPIETDNVRNAILGGGDIAFPMIFAGVIMKDVGFFWTLIIPVIVSVSLYYLLALAEKDKFYPAMPFLTAGCFVGWGIMKGIMFLF